MSRTCTSPDLRSPSPHRRRRARAPDRRARADRPSRLRRDRRRRESRAPARRRRRERPTRAPPAPCAAMKISQPGSKLASAGATQSAARTRPRWRADRRRLRSAERGHQTVAPSAARDREHGAVGGARAQLEDGAAEAAGAERQARLVARRHAGDLEHGEQALVMLERGRRHVLAQRRRRRGERAAAFLVAAEEAQRIARRLTPIAHERLELAGGRDIARQIGRLAERRHDELGLRQSRVAAERHRQRADLRIGGGTGRAEDDAAGKIRTPPGRRRPAASASKTAAGHHEAGELAAIGAGRVDARQRRHRVGAQLGVAGAGAGRSRRAGPPGRRGRARTAQARDIRARERLRKRAAARSESWPQPRDRRRPTEARARL